MLYSTAPVAMASLLATGCLCCWEHVRILLSISQRKERGGKWTYQELGQVVVGDVGQLLAVELGDDELYSV